jgi:hypothetical protein
MFWSWISFFILVLILFFRTDSARKKFNHSRWMSGIVLIDLVLVLYLATGKNVLSKINPDMNGILMVHVLVALTTVIGYFMALYFGYKLAKGLSEYRKHMQWIDRVVVPARVIVLITMVVLKLNTAKA